MLRGLLDQMQLDAGEREGRLQVGSMDIGAHVDEEAIGWDEPNAVEAEFYDEISGALLDPKLVAEARKKEIEFVREFGVYEKVPAEQAEGKAKVTVKWCDVNKGDAQRPEYRSRLVGRELRKWDPFMSGTFAATPPTESLRFMLSSFMTRGKQRDEDPVMGVLDVSRAHFHPESVREVYIDLPDEDASPGMVGRLKRTIYGTMGSFLRQGVRGPGVRSRSILSMPHVARGTEDSRVGTRGRHATAGEEERRRVVGRAAQGAHDDQAESSAWVGPRNGPQRHDPEPDHRATRRLQRRRSDAHV